MKYAVWLMVALTATVAVAEQRQGDVWDMMRDMQDERDVRDVRDVPDVQNAPSGLHGMVGATWDSKYLWRGFDVYDDESATHVMADLSLPETGFGGSAVGHRANSSGFEDRERWDLTAYYQNALFPNEPHATNFRVGWVYYTYPELNRGESIDLQEGHAVLAWPNILGVPGLQPSYVAVKLWPARSDSRLPDAASGWLHILMLDYAFSVPGIIPELPDHVIRLHSEVIYNDGVTPLPEHPNPDHDWSNAVFGASMDVAFGETRNIVITPAIYYQITMDSSINEDEDEVWASLSLKYGF